MTADIINLWSDPREARQVAARPSRVTRKTIKATLPADRFVPYGKGDGIGLAERTLAATVDAIAKAERLDADFGPNKAALAALLSMAESCKRHIIETAASGPIGAVAKLRMAVSVGLDTSDGRRLLRDAIATLGAAYPVHRLNGDPPWNGGPQDGAA